MVHGLMPFAVLTILPVLDAIDPRLTPAAASLGARPAEGFIRVLLPLAMPGVAAAGLIVFVTSVGFFIVPALLGGPRQTMVANVIIEMVLDLMNWPLASAAALLMFCVVAGLFGLYIHSFGVESLVGHTRTPARIDALHRPHLRRLAWRRVGWMTWDRVAEPLGRLPLIPTLLRHIHSCLGIALVLFLALPALFLIPVSFTVSGIIDWPPQFFSWRWYDAAVVHRGLRHRRVVTGYGLSGSGVVGAKGAAQQGTRASGCACPNDRAAHHHRHRLVLSFCASGLDWFLVWPSAGAHRDCFAFCVGHHDCRSSGL
jgi:putative spermidine/putrescine transport system permease protein